MIFFPEKHSKDYSPRKVTASGNVNADYVLTMSFDNLKSTALWLENNLLFWTLLQETYLRRGEYFIWYYYLGNIVKSVDDFNAPCADLKKILFVVSSEPSLSLVISIWNDMLWIRCLNRPILIS